MDHPWLLKTLRLVCITLLVFGLGSSLLPAAAQTVEPDFFASIPEGTPYIILTAEQVPEEEVAQRTDRYIPAPESYIQGTAAKTATINIGYDPVNMAPDSVKAALEYAKGVWETQLVSSVPILVQVSWENMNNPNALGGAYTPVYLKDFKNAPQGATYYPSALANKIAGFDIRPGDPDIVVAFNSAFPSWYVGTDGGVPTTKYDLVSVAVHEIGHGLGMAGSARYASGVGSWSSYPYPIIYDRFVYNGAGNSLLNQGLYPNGSTALGYQLVSQNLYFNGPKAVAANLGSRPRLFAPATWQQGSSYSHLDETTYPRGSGNALMTPQLANGEAVHSPGPIVMGIFEDLGWTHVTAPVNLAPRAHLPFLALNTSSSSLGIYGSVRQGSSAVSGVTVSLSTFGTSWTDVLTATTNSAGGFAFKNAPSLPSGQVYAVRYYNTTDTPGRLWYWRTKPLNTYTAGSQVEIGNFDITDIALTGPAEDAWVSLPYTFTWTSRPAALKDSYVFHLYQVTSTGQQSPWWWTDPPLGYASSYTLTGLPVDRNTNPVIFQTGTPYAWEIWVHAPDGARGLSYFYRRVAFNNAGVPPAAQLSTFDALDLDGALPPRP